MPPTNSMVENIVHIELSYINTKHPDFQREAAMVGSLMAYDDEKFHKARSSSLKPAKNRPVQFTNQPLALANGDDKENNITKVILVSLIIGYGFVLDIFFL